MVRRKAPIETISQAEAAYGGAKAMSRAFLYAPHTNGNGVANWKVRGVAPKGHHLGLVVGLLVATGNASVVADIEKIVSPKLLELDKWSDIAGWPSTRPKAPARKRKLRRT